MIEKLSRKAFLVTAALLAASLTFTLSSSSVFADKTTSPDGDVNSTVSLLINPSITLEIEVYDEVVDPNPDEGEINSMFIDMKPNMTSSGRFLALVTTNRDYILQLNGLDGDTTMTNQSDGTYYIPGTGCAIEDGTSCWKVMAWPSEYTNPPDGTTYQAIPEEPTEFARSEKGPVSEEETHFEVGISTSANIAPGTYKGKLVVTASNI